MKKSNQLVNQLLYLGYDKKVLNKYHYKICKDNLATLEMVCLLLMFMLVIITSFYIVFDNKLTRNIICVGAGIALVIVYALTKKMRNQQGFQLVYAELLINVFTFICFAIGIYLGTFAARDEMAVAPVWMFFFVILIFNRTPKQNIAMLSTAFVLFAFCSYITKQPRIFNYDMMHALTSVLASICMAWEKSKMKLENSLALDILEYANLEIMETVEEQEKETAMLRQKASRDDMTGLLNKSIFIEMVQMILNSSDQDSCHALLCIDFDEFKSINDNFGHLFGDEILKDIAQLLQEAAKQGNPVGRFGGDEFFLFFSDVTSKQEIIEKVQQLIKDANRVYHKKNKTFQISISIGVSFYPKSGNSYEDLFLKADAALYQAKKMGKNTYVIAEQEDTKIKC